MSTPDRRTLLLDTAIELLGEHGERAASHRSVDAAAGVPLGTTSNWFRTRRALLEAVVERFADRERAVSEALFERLSPQTPAELGRAMAVFAQEATGRHRALTLARYTILVETARQPDLRARLLLTGARVNAWFALHLKALGSADPDHDVHVLANYWTGLVLHQLAIPDPGFDPTDHLVRLVESLVPEPTVARSTR